MPKIWNKYFQKRNIGASVPISTFICLWANYIFPRWVCLFCWRKYVDRSWEYINRSQTHECRKWGCWGRAIPRKGIYKRNCHCSVTEHFYIGWLVFFFAYIFLPTSFCMQFSCRGRGCREEIPMGANFDHCFEIGKWTVRQLVHRVNLNVYNSIITVRKESMPITKFQTCFYLYRILYYV
jgi:hypothetical protein